MINSSNVPIWNQPLSAWKSASPRLLLGGLLVVAATFLASPGFGAEHDLHQDMAVEQHPLDAQPPSFNRSEATYKIPEITLLRQDGSQAQFPAELDDGRPVLLTFIFTSCTTVCPVINGVFASVQQKLGKEHERVHMLSISIDPDYDTPSHLNDYAKTLKAGPQWQFYTGTPEASIALQKAFAAYRGDKMKHIPVILLRAAPGKAWVRLDGLVNPDEVVSAYRKLVGGVTDAPANLKK